MDGIMFPYNCALEVGKSRSRKRFRYADGAVHLSDPVLRSRAVLQRRVRISISAFFALAVGLSSSLAQSLVVDHGFDPLLERNGNIITDIHRLPDGSLWVLGSFAFFDSEPAKGLVKLLADGTVDRLGSPLPSHYGGVRDSVLLSDGSLLLGGENVVYHGYSLVKLDSAGQIDRSFDSAVVGGTVLALYVQSDGKLIVGGDRLQIVGESELASVVRLSVSGQLDTTFLAQGPAGSYVSAIATQSDGKIVIGGGFREWEGNPRDRLARLFTNGALDPDFVSGGGNAVNEITVLSDDRLLVGRWTSPGYQPFFERLTSNGQLEYGYPELGSGHPLETVHAIVFDGESGYIVAGRLGVSDGGNHIGMARLDAMGGIEQLYETEPGDSVVTAVATLLDGRVVAGLLSSVGMTWQHPSIVAYDESGTLDPDYGYRISSSGTGNFNGFTRDGRVILGGVFNRVKNQSRNGVAFFTQSGELSDAFEVDFRGFVQGLGVVEKDNGNFLIAGSFSNIEGEDAKGVVETTSTGKLVRTFAFPFEVSLAHELVLLSDESFVVAYRSSNPSRLRLARFTADGTLDVDYAENLGLAGLVTSLAVDEQDRVVVAGYFQSVGEVEKSGLFRLTPAGQVDLTFNPNDEFKQVAGGAIPAGDGTYFVAGDAQLIKTEGVPDQRLVKTTADGRIDPAIRWNLVEENADFDHLVCLDEGTLLGAGFGGRLWLVNKSGGDAIAFEAEDELRGNIEGIGSDGRGGAWIGGYHFGHSRGRQTGVVRLIPSAARHSIQSVNQSSGWPESYTISNSTHALAGTSEVAWSVLIPDGWSLRNATGAGTTSLPVDGTTALAEWVWASPDSLLIEFTYDLVPGATTHGLGEFTGVIESTLGSQEINKVADPDGLRIFHRRPSIHSADMDGDMRLGLSELLRMIELYNTRSGTVRTGAYQEYLGSVDGYEPRVTDLSPSAVVLDKPHAADTNHDGEISLGELLGVIELYNTRTGSERTGAYRWNSGLSPEFTPDL